MGIDSTVAQFARPSETINAVGSTTMRASCAPFAAATASQALLRLAHGRAGETQRAAELQHEGMQLVTVRRIRRLVDRRARATICISWVVPFRRRPPSSVTETRSATIVVEGVVGISGARRRFVSD